MSKKVKNAESKNSFSKVAKVALGILGVGFVAGTALVIGMDRIMKKIFINEEWPEEEWSGEDWTDEDLEI